MSTVPLQGVETTLDSMARVSSDSPIPSQKVAKINVIRSSDFYFLHCLKFNDVAEFHCYEEFIYGLLLESDNSVSSFVPHPFNLAVNNRAYIPSFYVVRNNHREVIELNSSGHVDETFNRAVSSFFSKENISFKVISKESVLDRERLALHWLPLIQVMVTADQYGIYTEEIESNFLQKIINGSAITIGDLIEPGLRDEQSRDEIALYRLIHSNKVQVNLNNSPIDFDTEVKPWASHGDSV